jgi:hypothetical protein
MSFILWSHSLPSLSWRDESNCACLPFGGALRKLREVRRSPGKGSRRLANGELLWLNPWKKGEQVAWVSTSSAQLPRAGGGMWFRQRTYSEEAVGWTELSTFEDSEKSKASPSQETPEINGAFESREAPSSHPYLGRNKRAPNQVNRVLPGSQVP